MTTAEIAELASRIVREQMSDLRAMVERWETDRLNNEFVADIEDQIRASVRSFLAETPAERHLRELDAIRAEQLRNGVYAIIFLQGLDLIDDHHLYEVINTIVDSELMLQQQQQLLSFLLARVERLIDQEQAELIEAYQRILQIQPCHIRNLSAIGELIEDERLEVSWLVDRPAGALEEPRLSPWDALEIWGESDLANSLVLVDFEGLFAALRPVPQPSSEHPSDLEISIDLILPDEEEAEGAEGLVSAGDHEKMTVQVRDESPGSPAALSRVPIEQVLQLEEALRSSRHRQHRQRSYPPHEAQHIQRTPHLETG